jgi:uncharacterized LabA/DUF88 family protein
MLNPIDAFYSEDKLEVFVDGSNFHTTLRNLGIEIDYGRLRNMFAQVSRLIRISYYTALKEDENGVNTLRPLIDWLQYNGFRLVTKPVKRMTRANGDEVVKGNMDIEIAVDAMKAAEHCDHIVLVTGDGDFSYLVSAIQQKGVKVTVMSTISVQPPICADELRRRADYFMDIADVKDAIAK